MVAFFSMGAVDPHRDRTPGAGVIGNAAVKTKRRAANKRARRSRKANRS